jgi:uncharacterized protein YcfL
MESRNPSRLLVTLLCGLALAACRNAQLSDGGGGLPGLLPEGPFDEQPTDDRSVEAHLAQVIHTSQVIDGTWVVELDLHNKAASPLAFAYGIEWLDRSGEEVFDQEACWTPMLLGAGESRLLELRAPSPEADSWILMAVALPPR